MTAFSKEVRMQLDREFAAQGIPLYARPRELDLGGAEGNVGHAGQHRRREQKNGRDT
jgi:hypothetical protein